jgi:NAD-dependent deacetylase
MGSIPRTLKDPVVVLVGAGLSTASGIPDYRSDKGMWKMFNPDEFHIEAFLHDPVRFWDRRIELYQSMRLMDAEPNDGHRVLAEATADGRVHSIITQNVDGLHQRAGTPTDRLIEVHGNAALCVCMDCDERVPTTTVIEKHRPGEAPRCECNGYLKPDVVLFGEQVTELGNALRAAEDARTLITAGTSLQVWPVAGLAQVAIEQNADLIILNRDPTPFDSMASWRGNGDIIEELRRLFAKRG